MALKEFDYEKEPVVSIVKKILTDSIKMRATDIHFDPMANELSIKFRINSNLVEYTTAPESVKMNILTRVKIISGMNITESFFPQIGSINFEVDGRPNNMRVSTLPIVDGEKIVVHISNYAQNIKSLNKIGIDEEDVNKIKRLIKETQGLILITGTTSSGKTTTMYSILKELNSKSTNIITIEDPVKMKIDGINQVQLAPDKGITYKSVLKNVLLQDPNVICINELTDDEIARSAIRASITGRLVLSTLHTKTAYTTIDTLLNMDIENYLLGSNLVGIISQRLVKKLCPNCRELKQTTEYERNIIKAITGEVIEELYYPKGCTECQGGYVDQIPIVEVVEIDDELRSAISNKKDRNFIRKIIYSQNKSILENGFQKTIEGETSFNEIIRITDVKTDFQETESNIKDYILGNGEIEFIEKIEKEIEPVTEENTEDQIQTIKTENELESEEENNKEIIDEALQAVREETNATIADTENIEKVEIETEEEQVETPTEESTDEEVTENEPVEQKEEVNEENTGEQPLETSEEVVEESKEEPKEEEPKTPDYSTPLDVDIDDDDEDDFNYGDSYSIF